MLKRVGASEDGAIIVGASGHRSSNAVFWDARGAVHSLAEVLTDAGIDFAGSQLTRIDGAPNAGVLWGTAQGAVGPQVWVVRLP